MKINVIKYNDSHAPPTALKHNTGFLLSCVVAVSAQHYETTLKAVNFNPHHVGVLELVQARISEQLGIFKPIIVKFINELEAKEFVQRRPHPTDKRAVEIHLLPKGADCLKQIRSVSQQATKQFFGALSKTERQQFHNMLTKIANSAVDQESENQ